MDNIEHFTQSVYSMTEAHYNNRQFNIPNYTKKIQVMNHGNLINLDNRGHFTPSITSQTY